MIIENLEEAKKFLQLAVDEAANSVETGGGPFGAIIVKNGEIIIRANNMVTATNDPTAHAEVTAIRQACAKLNTFDLSGCVLYSSCEPCPMCLGASLWARLDKVYFAANQLDAAAAGFDDSEFYSVLKNENERLQFATEVSLPQATHPFQLWTSKADKIEY